MKILDVTIPDIPDTTFEMCHELTIRYSLAYVGRNANLDLKLDSNTFTEHLKKYQSTDKAPGRVATFWERDNLFHSMIVGNDDEHWIGSNNGKSFGIDGNRIFVNVGQYLRETDKILLKIIGNKDVCLYSLKYYKPEDVASYVAEDVARYVPEVDPEPGCCC